MAARSHNSSLASLIHDARIGPVSCEGREILRRIFVTVRDSDWAEVKPSSWSVEVDERERCARISARHTSESVDFEWCGILRVGADSRDLRFEVTGTALRDMQVSRLGLIVLHPVTPLIGADVMMIGPAGTQSLKVREQLYPQPIVNGLPGAMSEPFSMLRIERADVGSLQFKFEGDLFELEDQRNWGDASFKSYCTPLRLGFPRAVAAGTLIRHTVDVSFQPVSATHATARHESEPTARRFPLVGRVAGHDLCEPRWSHLQIRLGADHAKTLLEQLAVLPTHIPLELLIEAPAESLHPQHWAALRAHAGGIKRALIHGQDTMLPTFDDVDRWRSQLRRVFQYEVPLFATTRGYFVEHNRAARFAARVDGIAFPLTSTVHLDDPTTIAENVPTIEDMAQAARLITGLEAMAIAPLALYFPTQKPHDFPPALVAPWLVATLIHAALSGVLSVTIADDVLAELSASGVPRRLCACVGADVASLEATLPSFVHGVAIRRDDGRSFGLFANLQGAAVTVAIGDTSIELPPFGVAAVDAGLATIW